MSQGGILGEDGVIPPDIPTTFSTDNGDAVPIANVLEVLGDVALAGSDPVFTEGSGNTVTVVVQTAQAIAASNVNNIGLAAFNSADFNVDANGFVTLDNPPEDLTITGDTGGPISPSVSNWNLLGQGIPSTSGIQINGAGSTLSARMLSPYTLGDFTFTTATAAGARLVTISNSDNTNTNSRAGLLVQTGGTASGNPFVGFNIPGGLGYSWGINNSDGDAFALSSDSTFTGVGLCKFVPSLGRVTFGPSLDANDNLIVAINQSGNATAGSGVQIETSGGGDAYLNVNLTASDSYCFGIDNSDSDSLKINYNAATGVTPSSGTNLWRMTSAGAASYVNGNVDITRSAGGATVSHTISNTANSASSNALQQVTVGGTSAGDAFTTYTVTGGSSWSTGVDNSVSDSFVIAASTALGTTNIMSATTAGEINYPLQPAFLALGAAATDPTGDGTAYVPGSSGTAFTEIYDQNSDFVTTGTFTAPVTGRYKFDGSVQLSGILIAHTSGNFQLIASNRTLQAWAGSPFALSNAAGGVTLNSSYEVDMDAADTATLNVIVSNGTKVVDLNGSNTWFSGYLIA